MFEFILDFRHEIVNSQVTGKRMNIQVLADSFLLFVIFNIFGKYSVLLYTD